MDDGTIPKELNKKITWGIIIILTQSILFTYFIKSGAIILIGIITFMLIFSYREKKLKKDSENKILKIDDSWYISKYKLSKEIP